MITLKELQEWKDDLSVVVRDINTAATNLRIINVEKSKGNVFVNHNFFGFYSYQQKFMIIIQLAKLFEDNKETQKRNFNKLLNRLEKEKFDVELRRVLLQHKKNLLKNNSDMRDVFKNREEILKSAKDFRERVNSNKDLIEKIVNLRTKVYAHTDPEKTFAKISFNEIEQIVLFASDIYNTFFGKIFDLEIFFNDTHDWDLRYVIENLSLETSN